MRRGSLWLASALLAALAGCDSDEFGLVGNDLPKEVTQDSLAVEITVPISEEFAVEPTAGESHLEHDALVFGQRLRSVVDTLSTWRATPLVRFDFANPIVDEVPLPSPRFWTRVRFVFRNFKIDRYYGANPDSLLLRVRSFDVVELSAPLDSTMRDQSLVSLLGDVLVANPGGSLATGYEFEWLASPIDTLGAAYLKLRGWLDGGPHNGIAVVDRSTDYTAELTETLMRFAASEFPRNRSSALPPLSAGTVWIPQLSIAFLDPNDLSRELIQRYTPILDFTHIEREAPPAGSLRLGTHPDARSFLRADFAAAAIPSTATINKAELVLHVNNEFSLARGALLVGVYEATAGQVVATPLGDLDFVRRASTTVFPMLQSSFTLDVSDFVQRYVNRLIPAERGFLLTTILANQDEIRSIDLFGSSAVDSLRPYLRIQFTPPPDFQE
jgi:hypothetical protein